MIISKLENYTRGWFIGDFFPSILRTKDFEVGILKHKKGEKWAAHYHSIATEYNVLLEGSMYVCNVELKAGDVFIIEPNEVADPVFHEDCTIVCVKIPSAIGDKHLV
jgi:quercetin dioxygenase-like cupin family protein